MITNIEQEIPSVSSEYRPKAKIIDYEEAVAYFNEQLKPNKNIANPDHLPWEPKRNTEQSPKARNLFTLQMEYYLKVDSKEEATPISLDERFTVDDDAPEKIKHTIEHYKTRTIRNPVELKQSTELFNALKDGTHSLCVEQQKAEEAGDTQLEQIRYKEITDLTNFAEQQVFNLQDEAEILSDKDKWEKRHELGAEMMQRFTVLMSIIKKELPPANLEGGHEAFRNLFVEKANASQELDDLLQEGKRLHVFSPGSLNVKLYLYFYPDTKQYKGCVPVEK